MTVANKNKHSTEETIKSSATSVIFCHSFEIIMQKIRKDSTGRIGKKLFTRLFSAHMNSHTSMHFSQVLAMYI